MDDALWAAWRASAAPLATPEDQWAALWHTVALFRELASGLARDRCLACPTPLAATMTASLHDIQHLPRT